MDLNKINDYFHEILKIEALSKILNQNLLYSLENETRSFNPLYLAQTIHEKLEILSSTMDEDLAEEYYKK